MLVVEVKIIFELGVGVDQRHVALQINRLQSQPPHQPLHPLAIDAFALAAKPPRHLPRTEERIRQIRFIDQAHQAQRFLRLRFGLMIITRSRQPQQLALAGDGQAWMLDFDQVAALVNTRAHQLFF